MTSCQRGVSEAPSGFEVKQDLLIYELTTPAQSAQIACRTSCAGEDTIQCNREGKASLCAERDPTLQGLSNHRAVQCLQRGMSRLSKVHHKV